MRSCLSGGPGRKKSFWSSKRRETFWPSERSSTWQSGKVAQISALVSTRSLEIRDLDETVEKEEVVSALCLALGRPAFEASCRLFTRFGGVKTAVIRLAEADAARLLQLGKLSTGWVEYRIREHVEVARCFRCLGNGHGSRGCSNPDRKNACWRCGATGHLARTCKAQPRCHKQTGATKMSPMCRGAAHRG